MKQEYNEDKRVGRMLSKPSPKCKICGNYMSIDYDLSSSPYWQCSNCYAEFSYIAEVEKDEKTI